MQRSTWRDTLVVGLAVALIASFGACAERPTRDRAEKACHRLAELGRRHAVIEQVKAEWAQKHKGKQDKLDATTLNARVTKALGAGQAKWTKALAAKKGDLATCAEGFVSLGSAPQVDCILRAETSKKAKACRKNH